ncbi:MAG: hypothetical protein GWN58_04815 [Anaerolineae bacterium]|nr:hypothetical protein [Anaerolineae bacterium]
MSDDTQVLAIEQAGADAQMEPRSSADRDNVDLAIRFLVGLLSIGGDEAARRLQDMQDKLDAEPSLWESAATSGQESLGRQAWHLGVGLVNRGQKRLRRGIRKSYERSLRALDWASSAPERWGAGFVTRPVRKPMAALVLRWRQQAALIEKEGKLEEQMGRALTKGMIIDLILEIMDEVAENPELLEFIEHLLSHQGRGMASSVMDNTRSVTLTADDGADALLRWLLRRKPRHELPPSPVEGQRQTMYKPTVKVDGGGPDAD